MYICIHPSVGVFVSVRFYMFMLKLLYKGARVYLCIYIYKYTYIYTYIHMMCKYIYS